MGTCSSKQSKDAVGSRKHHGGNHSPQNTILAADSTSTRDLSAALENISSEPCGLSTMAVASPSSSLCKSVSTRDGLESFCSNVAEHGASMASSNVDTSSDNTDIRGDSLLEDEDTKESVVSQASIVNLYAVSPKEHAEYNAFWVRTIVPNEYHFYLYAYSQHSLCVIEKVL